MPQSLVVNTYTVVLAQAPTENVLVTEAATPPSEEEEHEGVQNIYLERPARRHDAAFTPTNWFIPRQ